MVFLFKFSVKPQVVKTLKDIEIYEGETLSLDVEIIGYPEPKFTWYKDGQELRADARLKISRDSHRVENYNLTLNLVKESDSGEYEIKASNNLGAVSSKSKVLVTSKWFMFPLNFNSDNFKSLLIRHLFRFHESFFFVLSLSRYIYLCFMTACYPL